MSFPRVPDAAAIASHFGRALRAARRDETPYRHWLLDDVLPEIVTLVRFNTQPESHLSAPPKLVLLFPKSVELVIVIVPPEAIVIAALPLLPLVPVKFRLLALRFTALPRLKI